MQSKLIGNSNIWVETRGTRAVLPVAHLTIHDSIINDTSINIETQDSTAVGIVQITNTILTHTEVTSEDKYSVGQIAFLIYKCTFIQSSLNSYGSTIVYIVNSKFDVKCQAKGCAMTLKEPNHDMDIPYINAMCDLFQIKMCYGIYLSNIDFIGTESEAEFLNIEESQTVITNCTFSVSNSVQKHLAQNPIFELFSKIIKLVNINVKVNVTEVRSVHDIPLFRINTVDIIAQNVFLFCPKSFKVIETISENDNYSQFLCQKEVCPLREIKPF